MFTAHPFTPTSMTTVRADDGTMRPTGIVPAVPAHVAGSRSIVGPVTPFRGIEAPPVLIRRILQRERAYRAGLRAEAAMRASARPLRGHPVIVTHDGTDPFQRSIIVGALLMRADANARRFGTAKFGG